MDPLIYKLVAAAFAAAFFASSSHAAPRAQSAEECGIAADMALVAQSLAREEIQPAKASAIMARTSYPRPLDGPRARQKRENVVCP